MSRHAPPWITNDSVVAGLLLAILALIFWTAHSPHRFWRNFYGYVPLIFVCYFVPSLLPLLNLVDPETSQLYTFASRNLLPACLILLTISIDMRQIWRLGPHALAVFLAGSLGVVVGGPLTLLILRSFSPEMMGGSGNESLWRGMATLAGSWIGGAANQTAMREVYQPSDALFTALVAVDIVIAEIWTAILLLAASRSDVIDRWLRADSSAVQQVRSQLQANSVQQNRPPTVHELMILLGVAFGAAGISHWLADRIAPWIADHAPSLSRFSLDSQFFWLVLLSTTFGLGLSFTSARKLEALGASKVGTLFIFFIVATIGLKMDIRAVYLYPAYFLLGAVWMVIHAACILGAAYALRAPFFFVAVGSKANIGGAASAPIVAAAFHPALAPVGVLLAVLGYALGTYGAWLCASMMQAVSRGPL